jgi:TRAP-type uncharacterized transport system substrate-binding protein
LEITYPFKKDLTKEQKRDDKNGNEGYSRREIFRKGGGFMAKKQITFAGSTVGEPWWQVGEVVAKVLEPHGYQVNITHESFAANNVRWITGRKAEVGATTPSHLEPATKGIHEFEGEEHKDFTSIATVKRPNWLALALRHDTGLCDLHDVKKKQYPLRILAASPDKGRLLDTVLRHYGMSLEEIQSWGGRFMKWSGRERGSYVREGVVDMMLGNIYIGYTPHNRFWYEATTLFDMRFLNLDEALIEKLVNEYGYVRGTIPHDLFRGVDRDIPSVGQEFIYIYCLKSQPAELVRLIAEGLDKNSDFFKQTRSAFYYERNEVWRNPYIPLHPAAEEYYRSKGYMG